METDDLQDCSQLDLWSASVRAHVCTHMAVSVCACTHGCVYLGRSYSLAAILAELSWGYGRKKTPQRNKSKTPVPSYQGRNRNMGAMTAALSS